MRAIAFYLPQFHPIRENDEWWGKGFTEWTNVAKARPLFPGHHQPHLPAELGFYDLRLPEVRQAQAELAREHGIHGFCYYHYWFNGRRLLERPFEEVLKSGAPDFPFCLCWANEHWTRVWDGSDRHILLEQRYSLVDDRAHIRSLIPAFKDPRYIRIHGKPLFLTYRTELLPSPAETAALWQEEAKQAGLPGLYLARVENFRADINPREIGFDAAVEFSPNSPGRKLFRGRTASLLAKVGLLPRVLRDALLYSYPVMANRVSSKPDPAFLRYRCVCPMWDNSARRDTSAAVFLGSTPAAYQRWLTNVIAHARQRADKEEHVVFINAWNEWAEGCHLEPDRTWGRAYLEATRAALLGATVTAAPLAPSRAVGFVRRTYWRLAAFFFAQADFIRILLWHLKHRLPPR